jgi:hypothetical protein
VEAFRILDPEGTGWVEPGALRRLLLQMPGMEEVPAKRCSATSTTPPPQTCQPPDLPIYMIVEHSCVLLFGAWVENGQSSVMC